MIINQMLNTMIFIHMMLVVRETLQVFGSITSGSWNKDQSYLPYGINYLFMRGGPSNDGSGSGIFAFWSKPGSAYGRHSFRIVLTTQDIDSEN